MDIALIIIAIILGLVGLVGVIVPVIPGTLLSYGGLLYMYFTSETTITVTQLVIFGVVSTAAIVLDYILPGYFSKKFGGTKYGIAGATVGAILGVFFGLIGIILGPFVGAVIGELIGNKIEFNQALKVGFGSLLAFLASSGIMLIVSIYILVYIFKDVFACLF